MALSKVEQETIINFNRAGKEAAIYSADPVVIRKLDKLCEEQPDVYQFIQEWKDANSGQVFAKAYTVVDKKLIRFAKKREYTEEQLEVLRERGRALFSVREDSTEDAE